MGWGWCSKTEPVRKNNEKNPKRVLNFHPSEQKGKIATKGTTVVWRDASTHAYTHTHTCTSSMLD